MSKSSNGEEPSTGLENCLLTLLQNINCVHRAFLSSSFRSAGRIAVSTSLPMRMTMPGRASISSSEVRKFTIQARNTKVPPITALERKASPLFCNRVNSSAFHDLAQGANESQARSEVSWAIRLERQGALGGYRAIQQPGLLSDSPLCEIRWGSFRAARCDISVRMFSSFW